MAHRIWKKKRLSIVLRAECRVLKMNVAMALLSLCVLLGSVQCAPRFLSVWCPEPIKSTTFQRGAGTTEDPYVICSTSHFQNISSYPSATFRIGTNLDFTGVTLTTIPLFTGTIFGGGTALTGIARTGTSVSLIYELQGTIRDLSIQADLTDAGAYLGILAATATSGTIENINVSGTVSGVTGVGGLLGGAGTNPVSIRGCTSSVTVTSTGDNAGGLVGELVTGASIVNSYTTGSVTSGAGNYLGGLVGVGIGAGISISNSGATGNVTASGGARAGGLVGQMAGGTISKSFATGNVSAGAGAGGLVGEANVPIDTSYATGNVTSATIVAGGLVGRCTGCSIADSHYRGGVVSAGTDAAGGLIGDNTAAASTVVRSYAAATSVTSATNTGGFLGLDNLAGAGVDETSCFFDSSLVAAAGPDGTGIPTASMQDPSFFLAAGFSNSIWNLDGGYSGYLRLR